MTIASISDGTRRRLPGFKSSKGVSLGVGTGQDPARHAGMNYLAFIVQIFEPFQNVLRKAQDKLEGESPVRQLSL